MKSNVYIFYPASLISILFYILYITTNVMIIRSIFGLQILDGSLVAKPIEQVSIFFPPFLTNIIVKIFCHWWQLLCVHLHSSRHFVNNFQYNFNCSPFDRRKVGGVYFSVVGGNGQSWSIWQIYQSLKRFAHLWMVERPYIC